jgi:hypothetical protein
VNITDLANDPTKNIHGLSRSVISKRIHAGWTVDRALSTPKINPKKYSDEIMDLADDYGVSPSVFRSRISKGWDEYRAATTPPLTNSQAGKMGKKASHWSDPRPAGIKWMAP